ncbi:hypothetical protein SAMD00079811_24490 [Scytonema sp. HK-05]|nr:hypothetical protein SAMD00079811_24490 [Scytonema sp. HK-05]
MLTLYFILTQVVWSIGTLEVLEVVQNLPKQIEVVRSIKV